MVACVENNEQDATSYGKKEERTQCRRFLVANVLFSLELLEKQIIHTIKEQISHGIFAQRGIERIRLDGVEFLS